MARIASTSNPPPRAAASRPSRRPARRSGIGSTLVGLFIGIAVGLGLAAGVAFYLMRAGNPYQPAVSASAAPRDPARSGKGEAAAEKPRFDFYKILPGAEEPKGPQRPPAERSAGDRATLERALAPEKAPGRDETRPQAVEKLPEKPAADAATAKSSDRFWLQAGSFSTEGDAENLKAQLALSGWEASLQQATLPDRSVRYRVRLGPYANVDEMNRIRGDLAKRGFEVSAIKN